MMLWYKAWRESRAAFLICTSVLTAMCIAVVLLEPTLRGLFRTQGSGLDTYEQYVYKLIYSGSARGLYSIFAIVLGLGGLQRERAQNSAGFTLALPVGRSQLVTVRAVAGLAQILALSVVPVILIPSLSVMVNQSYPISQALGFSVLWITCGSVIFSAAFLASTIFSGEYTALTVTFVAYVFSTGLAVIPGFNGYPLQINHIMSGYNMAYFNSQTGMLIDPLPWTILIGLAMVASAFIATAARITLARDFS